MKFTFFLFAFITTITQAQIPNGYYNSATGNGYKLKSQLKDIITKGHITRSYADLYNSYKISDKDNFYEKDTSILDMYSENPSGKDPYKFTSDNKCGTYKKEGNCYNREHLIPQSFFGKKPPMKSDSHFVVPSDGYVNNRRSRFPFGYVSNANYTSANGSKKGTGNNKGYTGTVFEPIDEFKGDIARAVLYFAVRYEDYWNNSGWLDPNLNSNPMNGTSDQFYDDWFLETMLEWHNNDPVSQREISRNNAVYTFQGNRNPFIDHPEYINRIWVSRDTAPPTTPTHLKTSNSTQTTIDLKWIASTDNSGVTGYDIFINNTYLKTVKQSPITVAALTPNTDYCFKIRAKDAFENISNFSNINCKKTTTETPNGVISDLFISEYVEGSSYNKALEIANFTGKSIPLNNYSLKLATNGANFSTTYSFPINGNTLENGNVFVITHNKIAVSCKGENNDNSHAIVNFNGNDVIGLFKNDNLIDIIGTIGNNSNFAKDLTLVRKNSITTPNPIYDTTEWIKRNKDDCSNLGVFNKTPTIKKNSFNDIIIKLVPNPITGDILKITPSKKATVRIYNMLGKQLVKRYLKNENTINLKHLNSGLYIIKINTVNEVFTQKIVKQ